MLHTFVPHLYWYKSPEARVTMCTTPLRPQYHHYASWRATYMNHRQKQLKTCFYPSNSQIAHSCMRIYTDYAFWLLFGQHLDYEFSQILAHDISNPLIMLHKVSCHHTKQPTRQCLLYIQSRYEIVYVVKLTTPLAWCSQDCISAKFYESPCLFVCSLNFLF